MGTNENSKNIPISYDVTFKERRKIERKREKRKKRKKEKGPVNRNQENKSEKKIS